MQRHSVSSGEIKFLSKSVYVINSTTAIRKKYSQMHQTSKFLIEKEKEGLHFLPTIPNLLCDIFSSLYMPYPYVKKWEEISSHFLINMTIMESLLVNDSYKRVRDKTCFSPFASLWATEMFAEKLVKSLSRRKYKKKIDKINSQNIEKIDLEIKEKEKKKKFLPFNFPFFPSSDYNKEKKIEVQKKNIQKLKKKMSNVSLSATHGVLMEIDNIKNVVEICQGWDIEQKLNNLSYQEKMTLAAKVKSNSRFRELARIVGHIRQLALSSRYAKIHDLPYEIYNVVLGDDLLKIHPVEITYLSHPSFQYDFYQRLAYKKLMQYELKGTETTGEGSIIVCVDTSGSMSGKPETMSKAVSLGLLEIARADKRNFISIIFGQKNKVRTFIFKRDEVEIYRPDEEMKVVNFAEGLLEFATGFIGGGTDFETPLNTAFSFREKDEIYKDADLIFITDDICEISEDFLKKYHILKQKKQFRTYGILIGPKFQESNTMKKFCDEVINYHVFTEELATDIFKKVSTNRH